MNKFIKVMMRSVIVNIVLVFTKVVVGIIGSSTALIADGIHSLSDLATDIVAIVSSKLADKPADKEHPYGHGKIEYICCIFISVLVVFLGISLVYNAFYKEKLVPSVIVVYATIVTIILKYLLSSYILKKGHEYNSQLLITSGFESRTDVISSFIVFVSSILSQLSYKFPIFGYSDFIATIILGLFIFIMGFKMLISNLKIILGEKETNEDLINAIKEVLRNYDGINSYNNLTLIHYGSYYKCDLTVFILEDKTVGEASISVDNLKKKMRLTNPAIKYINISIKPYYKKEGSDFDAGNS